MTIWQNESETFRETVHNSTKNCRRSAAIFWRFMSKVDQFLFGRLGLGDIQDMEHRPLALIELDVFQMNPACDGL